MNCVLFLILLIVISFNLVGCVILPLPSIKALEEKPFLAEQTSAIVVGITTKAEVENLLGAPDATRRDSTIYIFAEPHIYGYLLFVDLYWSDAAIKRLEKHHLLIVQFDKNGIVKDVDHTVGNGTCTQNGIYVADTGLRPKVYLYLYSYPKPEDISVQQMLVLYSNRITEQNAKSFIVPHGKSVIYVYREKFPKILPFILLNQKVTVNLDCIELGDFGEEGFFYWIADPGHHSITVTPLWPEPENRWLRHASASIEIECKEGQIYFVEQTWESKQRYEFDVRLNMLSDPIKGRHEVMKRRLILDCLEQID